MGNALTAQLDMIAQAFVAARAGGTSLARYPGAAPVDLTGAYAIQDHAIAIDGRAIAGWKVGRINAPLDSALGSNRLAGPVFADSVVTPVAGECPAMPVFAEGFAAAEAEFLLHVAPGFSGAVPTDDAGTKAILDDVRIGIEIASSPYPGINNDGPLVTISDYGNNAGLVCGASLAGWQDIDLCAVQIRTEIDGAVIGAATAAAMLDGPYGAVRFLLGNLVARGIDVSGGLWVSTGAVTGVHEVRLGQAVRAVFEGCGEVLCTIAAAQPRHG